MFGSSSNGAFPCERNDVLCLLEVQVGVTSTVFSKSRCNASFISLDLSHLLWVDLPHLFPLLSLINNLETVLSSEHTICLFRVHEWVELA